jgi:hypothetical protein
MNESEQKIRLQNLEFKRALREDFFLEAFPTIP